MDRLRTAPVRRRRRWPWPLVGAVLALSLAAVPVRWAPVQGASMEPTLHDGGLVCYHLVPDGWLPRRGQLVVFDAPTREGHLFVKRLVGLPGDEIRFRNGRLLVNGLPLELPPGAIQPGYAAVTHVPPGHFYVLGDHAAVSYDSRRFGAVPQDRLVGRLLLY